MNVFSGITRIEQIVDDSLENLGQIGEIQRVYERGRLLMMNERRDVGLVDHVLFAQLTDHETQVGHQREHETRHRVGKLHDQIISIQLKQNKKLTFLIKKIDAKDRETLTVWNSLLINVTRNV